MRLIRLGVCIVLLSLLVACARPVEEEVSFPIEITDQQGRIVKLEKIPQRIISLSPGHTEIVFALGLEDRLVGVTEYCDYPEAAKDKPKIGGFSTVDIERLVEIQPDLILATNIHKKEVIPELERLGLAVLNLYPKTLDEVLEAITLIGQCTGREEEASLLITEMRNRIKAVIDKTANLAEVQKPGVFYVIVHEPLRTPGSDNRIHELIVSAGGINIFQDLSGISMTVSLEAVIQANPQVIIAGSSMGTAKSALEFLKTDERLRNVDARINNRIYEIDVNLISRPGPRIVDALALLAKMIQPEVFGPPEN